ncbi:hypothetical protein E5720_07300 [Rhodococcus sp. PAMC28707]|uniref:hypothetical protein n=1 Tax=unclassified Rhodococcus (in: high G+C Gram-positive bacteria) TaxID=192944 RepID=UPI00109DDAA7|nr:MULTISPECIES: hypothetical protein [unclassified Rhodococcus (in: high G+C Gram-positive bacteria)]QCB49962.1 hypothetical protein E5769_06715 [Rhodococcus sp. PAMC28705]QCB58345.1 hypothetical protein E5720_07300 [Rhodococcus sp. PAMC28707]
MSRNTITYKATALDMLRSDSRLIGGLGPADFGGIERVRARLRKLASAGPAARLGLRVTPSTQQWAYEPDAVCAEVESAPPITAAGIADALVELSSTVSTGVPLRGRLAGEYLLLDLSHGLSDALLPVELYAYLADPSENPPLPTWATAPVVKSPLPRAFTGWAVRNPCKVGAVLSGRLRASRSASTSTSAETTAVPRPIPWTRSPAVATATSRAGTPTALRAWRDRKAPDLSVASMLCGAVANAIAAQGISVAQSLTFLFDCRRYLPKSDLVLGNFAVGIDFHGLDPASPRAVHSAVAHAIVNGRPLAGGALSALSYLRTRSVLPATAVDTVPANADARLTFSDLGRIRQLDGIAWTAEPEKSRFYPLSEPALPDSVVITSMHVRDTFQVSASFHGNVFDVETVQSALDVALSDPIAMLSGQE